MFSILQLSPFLHPILLVDSYRPLQNPPEPLIPAMEKGFAWMKRLLDYDNQQEMLVSARTPSVPDTSFILSWALICWTLITYAKNCPSPSSGEAYSDRQRTPNFELWVEILCANIFPCEDSKILSVCPYPERRNHLSFVNISPTLVIDTSMERSSWVLQHENQKKNWFLFQKRSKF